MLTLLLLLPCLRYCGYVLHVGLLQVMIGASEVGSVKPLVKERQHVKKVRRGQMLQYLHTVLPACCNPC
jgi:hypothetical protein